MTQLELELAPQSPAKLVRVSKPYSAGGKVYTVEVRHLHGVIIHESRFKFAYDIEYIPKLGCYRARRRARIITCDGGVSDFASYGKPWNKQVDMPWMSDAMSALEDMISEEVRKWK